MIYLYMDIEIKELFDSLLKEYKNSENKNEFEKMEKNSEHTVIYTNSTESNSDPINKDIPMIDTVSEGNPDSKDDSKSTDTSSKGDDIRSDSTSKGNDDSKITDTSRSDGTGTGRGRGDGTGRSRGDGRGRGDGTGRRGEDKGKASNKLKGGAPVIKNLQISAQLANIIRDNGNMSPEDLEFIKSKTEELLKIEKEIMDINFKDEYKIEYSKKIKPLMYRLHRNILYLFFKKKEPNQVDYLNDFIKKTDEKIGIFNETIEKQLNFQMIIHLHRLVKNK